MPHDLKFCVLKLEVTRNFPQIWEWPPILLQKYLHVVFEFYQFAISSKIINFMEEFLDPRFLPDHSVGWPQNFSKLIRGYYFFSQFAAHFVNVQFPLIYILPHDFNSFWSHNAPFTLDGRTSPEILHRFPPIPFFPIPFARTITSQCVR